MGFASKWSILKLWKSGVRKLKFSTSDSFPLITSHIGIRPIQAFILFRFHAMQFSTAVVHVVNTHFTYIRHLSVLFCVMQFSSWWFMWLWTHILHIIYGFGAFSFCAVQFSAHLHPFQAFALFVFTRCDFRNGGPCTHKFHISGICAFSFAPCKRRNFATADYKLLQVHQRYVLSRHGTIKPL